MTSKNIFLASGLRTPFGAFGGALKSLSAPQLAAPLIYSLQKNHGIPNEAIDEVILGHVIQGGAGQSPARQAIKYAGLDDSTKALTINKVCGSGLKAIMLACDQIKLAEAHLIYAGGMESMSQAPFTSPNLRWGQALGNVTQEDLILKDALTDPYSGKAMGLLTEKQITAKGITRKEQDDYAVLSYQKAQSAQKAGLLAEEICPITVTEGRKERVVSEDEEPVKVRFDKISGLRPVFDSEGSITAANASSINDGAALCLIASEEALVTHKITPLAKIIAYSQHSQAPDEFSLAPIGAITSLLAKTNLSLKDIDLFEINEAFAAVPLMVAQELGLDLKKINIKGGAVSLGHPVGASGGRLALHLALEMRRQQAQYAIATLCIGGGEAVAILLEKP